MSWALPNQQGSSQVFWWTPLLLLTESKWTFQNHWVENINTGSLDRQATSAEENLFPGIQTSRAPGWERLPMRGRWRFVKAPSTAQNYIPQNTTSKSVVATLEIWGNVWGYFLLSHGGGGYHQHLVQRSQGQYENHSPPLYQMYPTPTVNSTKAEKEIWFYLRTFQIRILFRFSITSSSAPFWNTRNHITILKIHFSLFRSLDFNTHPLPRKNPDEEEVCGRRGSSNFNKNT
jgi:hypothetical protein